LKQVIQSYDTGELRLAEVDLPALKPDTVLVKTANSLISVGTERYMLDLAKKSLLGKAMARPDLVKQVINKVKSEGPLETYRQVKGRLDTPIPMGYSAAGKVVAVGANVTGFAIGDRVACAGSGIASHAEMLRVPQTLAVKIPDNVGFEAASFVTLGAIAMHGARMAKPTFGDRVVVLGLGLLGQLAVQILNAAGCRVFGIDVAPGKVAMALEHGAHAGGILGQDDLADAVRQFSDGYGADAVIIFASTESNDPIELAAELARDKGRIVVPGLVGLDIPRKIFYEKELDFVVSRAWGAGMYDPAYEAGSTNYPISYVRWTAERNLAHVLELMSDGKLSVEHLITHRFPLDEAVTAYEMIMGGKEPTIGVVLQYPEEVPEDVAAYLRQKSRPTAQGNAEKILTPLPTIGLGLIGAGLFARGTLLPALEGMEQVQWRGVATSTGLTSEHIARKYHFNYATSEIDRVLDDSSVNLVMILTRHNNHAALVKRALEAGKHVFVEKPLAITPEQLEMVEAAYATYPGQVMVGFNRRFAPTTQEAIRRFAHRSGPLMINMRVNVGYIPAEVWVHDPAIGGGNLVGEACHFFDLAQALTGGSPVSVFAQAVKAESRAVITEDNLVITLTMADGSVATILYTAEGDKAFSRERVEIFGNGAACVIDNFKTLSFSRGGKQQRVGNLLSGVDRGHRAEMQTLIEALQKGRPFPVSFRDYVRTTRATFAAMESLKTGLPVVCE
jgi:predicted dehydrogenase